MIPTGIVDELGRPHRYLRVHKAVISLDKGIPFCVLRHDDWADPQLLDCSICRISLSFKNACVCVVRLLDFANNDRLELSPRVLQVKVGLQGESDGLPTTLTGGDTHLVKIIFFINLTLELPVHRQP